MKQFRLISIFTLILVAVALIVGFSGTAMASSHSKAKDTAKTITDNLPTKPININAANLETLMNLPGIGEKRAQDILNFRKENGPFKNIEQLMEVPGIGEGIFNKIKSVIKIK